MSWHQYYLKIIDRLDTLEKDGNIFLKSALALGQKEKIIEKLYNLDLLFHEYYKIPDFLHEHREIVAKKIHTLCTEINELTIVDWDQDLSDVISDILDKLKVRLLLHLKEITNDRYSRQTARKLLAIFPVSDKSTQNYILKTENCKKHSEVLAIAMQKLINDSLLVDRLLIVELFKNNGFVIEQSFTCGFDVYKNFLEYAVSTSTDNDEDVIFKLIDLGSSITTKTIHIVLEYGSLELMTLVLEKTKYIPVTSDYENIIIDNKTACNSKTEHFTIQRFKLLCDKYNPNPDILYEAIKHKNFIIAKILIDDYALAKTPSVLVELLLKCEVNHLKLFRLSLPGNILLLKETHGFPLYRALNPEKIQYCLDNGASIQNIGFSSNVLCLPDLVADMIKLHEEDNGGKKIQANIHFAVIHGHPESLRHLIIAGLDVNAKDCSGKTALHFAAELMRFEMVKILVEEGADVDALDNEKRTPFDYADRSRFANNDNYHFKSKITSMLLQASNQIRKDKGILPDPAWNFYEIRKNSQILAQGYRSEKSFFAYLPMDILCLIASLLGNNRNKIQPNQNSYAVAYHCFASRPGQELSINILLYALSQETFPVTNYLLNKYSIKIDNSILKKENFDLVDIIQNCSIDDLNRLNLPIPKSILVVNQAHQHFTSDKIEFLIKKGACIDGIDLTNAKGILNFPELVRELLKKSKYENQGDILHRAVEFGHPETVRILIIEGFDADAIDKDHRTPLYFAAERHDKKVDKTHAAKVIKVLVEEGGCLDLDKRLKNPTEIAADKGLPYVASGSRFYSNALRWFDRYT